jgi:hypothetical protein
MGDKPCVHRRCPLRSTNIIFALQMVYVEFPTDRHVQMTFIRHRVHIAIVTAVLQVQPTNNDRVVFQIRRSS